MSLNRKERKTLEEVLMFLFGVALGLYAGTSFF